VSNYDRAGFLYDDDRAVVIGPETVNGTGEVYLNADAVSALTATQARELAAALVEAADYAEAVQAQMGEWPIGRPPNSVLAFAWTDLAWRTALESGEPIDAENSA
jgi:hypothetical protein